MKILLNIWNCECIDDRKVDIRDFESINSNCASVKTLLLYWDRKKRPAVHDYF